VSITMAFEILVSLQPLKSFNSNPFTLIYGLGRCRGSVTFIVRRETLRCALGSMKGRSCEGLFP